MLISISLNEKGIASTELVLILPIVLVVVVLMIHALRISHIGQSLQVEVRTAAWQEGLFGTVCDDVGARLRVVEQSERHPLLITCEEPDSYRSQQFLSQSRSAGTSPRRNWNSAQNVRRMTQVLDGTEVPGRSTEAETVYLLDRIDAAKAARQLRGLFRGLGSDSSVLDVSDALYDGAEVVEGELSKVKFLGATYALDIRPAWLNQDLQIGFDNFYWNRFPKHFVINDYFPCATGDETSAIRGDCEQPPAPTYESDQEIAADPVEEVRRQCRSNCEMKARQVAERESERRARADEETYRTQNPNATEQQVQQYYIGRRSTYRRQIFNQERNSCLAQNCSNIQAGQVQAPDPGTMLTQPAVECEEPMTMMGKGSTLSTSSFRSKNDDQRICEPPSQQCGVNFLQTMMPIPVSQTQTVSALGDENVISYRWSTSEQRIADIFGNATLSSAQVQGKSCGEFEVVITVSCGIGVESSARQMTKVVGNQTFCTSAEDRKSRLIQILRSEIPLMPGDRSLSPVSAGLEGGFTDPSIVIEPNRAGRTLREIKAAELSLQIRAGRMFGENFVEAVDETLDWLEDCVEFYVKRDLGNFVECFVTDRMEADEAIKQAIDSWFEYKARRIDFEATLELEEKLRRRALELAQQIDSCCQPDPDLNMLRQLLENSRRKRELFRERDFERDIEQDFDKFKEINEMCGSADDYLKNQMQCDMRKDELKDRIKGRPDQFRRRFEKRISEYCAIEQDPTVCESLNNPPVVQPSLN